MSKASTVVKKKKIEIVKHIKRRAKDLITLITDENNMRDALEEVISDMPKGEKERYRRNTDKILAKLVPLITSGEFRVTRFEEFEVTDGPKRRKVQSPPVDERIGINAIMRVVERFVYPTVIRTSAASIKGRGMHKLFRKMRSDIRHDREGTRYYYECDIEKFYESIDQDLLCGLLEGYVKDPVVLRMLQSFARVMKKGISIGLRSSQCYGNLLLSALDHRMKEKEGFKYYYRYCDDIRVLCGNKRECWLARDIVHEEVAKLRLRIKRNEAVRPLTEGNDFLGYIDDGEHSRLRKRTKVKAARKLSRVRSRKRRREIIGSFKGMAKWGDCIHLYEKITGKKMKEFKNIGLQYVAEDGKKRFGGKQVSLRSLQNKHISILDYEKEVKTDNGLRTLVSFQYDDGSYGKYFTADKQQEWYLDKLRELGEIPFSTTIDSEVFGNGKVRYIFT